MIEGLYDSKKMDLSELVTIQAGYPFRGAIRDIPSGDAAVVQAKDISDLGEFLDENLIITDLTGKRDADWLMQGDVLFSAKGAKHVACYIDKSLEKTTSSPSLFLLRLKPEYQNKINSQFLAWQINQQPVQDYFYRCAEGSLQISIRKAVLAATPILLPKLKTQCTIAMLYSASIREDNLYKELKNNRQQQFSAISNRLIRNTVAPLNDNNG
jgi:restriction endonuclease S subunit